MTGQNWQLMSLALHFIGVVNPKRSAEMSYLSLSFSLSCTRYLPANLSLSRSLFDSSNSSASAKSIGDATSAPPASEPTGTKRPAVAEFYLHKVNLNWRPAPSHCLRSLIGTRAGVRSAYASEPQSDDPCRRFNQVGRTNLLRAWTLVSVRRCIVAWLSLPCNSIRRLS